MDTKCNIVRGKKIRRLIRSNCRINSSCKKKKKGYEILKSIMKSMKNEGKSWSYHQGSDIQSEVNANKGHSWKTFTKNFDLLVRSTYSLAIEMIVGPVLLRKNPRPHDPIQTA